MKPSPKDSRLQEGVDSEQTFDGTTELLSVGVGYRRSARVSSGNLDFSRLHALHEAGAFFLIRAKRGLRAKRRYSHPVDRLNAPVLCDQTVALARPSQSKGSNRPLSAVNTWLNGP